MQILAKKSVLMLFLVMMTIGAGFCLVGTFLFLYLQVCWHQALSHFLSMLMLGLSRCVPLVSPEFHPGHCQPTPGIPECHMPHCSMVAKTLASKGD